MRQARAAPDGPPLRYDVSAVVDAQHDRVTSKGRITWRDATPGGEAELWLYADRARQLPPATNDLNLDRRFPNGLARGGFVRVTTEVEGCSASRRVTTESTADSDAVRGRLLRVSICTEATQPVTIRFESELDVPRRYGTLGSTGAGVVLGDPWYPILLGEGGVPLRGDHVLDVAFGKGILTSAAGVHRDGRAHIAQTNVSHAPLAVLGDAAVHEEVFGGVHITLVTKSAIARADPAPLPDGTTLVDPWDSDSAAAAIVVARRCIQLLRRLGFTAAPRPAESGAPLLDPIAPGDPRKMPSAIVIVELPERERLAVALPGMLAMSDRAYRILPFGPVLKFHDLAIARRLFATLIAPRVEASEPLRDRPWVSDLDGTVLVDLMLALESDSKSRPEDLIGFAGFHPAIDQLLYAPKAAFTSSYFGDIAERDPDRDGGDRAANDLPFGYLVIEKLRDRVGPPIASAIEEHLLRGARFRDAAQRATKRNLEPFFRTWLGPLPKLSYRLVDTTDTRSGNGFVHRARIERIGATWVEEPVVVELVDADGVSQRTVWDAPGAYGTIEWTSNAPLRDIQVDPDGRLIQDPDLTADHPRFDDELRHSWRPPILSTLSLSLSVTEGRPDAVLDFILKRRYDYRQWFGITAASLARGISGGVRYGRGLGPRRDLNSTFTGLTFALSGLRSQNGFGGSTIPIVEGDLSLTLAHDTRIDGINPRHGWGIGASISGGAAREDAITRDGTKLGGDVQPSASVAVRAEAIQALHPRHILVGAIGAGATVCPALPQQLQALSGRSLLRGYAADELIGCSTAYAIGEYRLVAVNGLYWNAAQLAWFKGLELVPFAAAGLLSSRESALFERFYGEVGGGLRAFFDYGGVQPGVLAIDMGVPLSRTSSIYTDANGLLRRRPPFGFYLSFQQAL